MTNINHSSRSQPLQNNAFIQKSAASSPVQKTGEEKSSDSEVSQAPEDHAQHQSLGSAESAPNQVKFGSDENKSDKQTEIKELDAAMSADQAELAAMLKDPKNDEMEVLGFIMEHAEQTLSEDDFATLERRLFPQPPEIPNDATPEQKAELMKDYEGRLKQAEEMKEMLTKNLDIFRKSNSPQALDNLVKYLAKNTVNVAKENPGC